MNTPGWFNDPDDPARARWHDGQGWTKHSVAKADWEGRGMPPPPRADDWGAPPAQPQARQPAFPAASPPPAQAPYAPPALAAGDARRQGRAEGAAEKARRKAMRPWYQKKRFLLPIGVLTLGVLAAVAGGGGDDKDPVASGGGGSAGGVSADGDEFDDVTIDSCTENFGIVTAGMTILNNSSKASDYLIEFDVTDAGGTKVGDGYASSNNVRAGDTARIDGVGTASDAAQGSTVNCVLTDVERFASN